MSREKGLILLCCLFAYSNSIFSMTWQDFWWRKDQQAMSLLTKGNNEQAAKTFEQPIWKAVANYRAKNYMQAEKLFSAKKDAVSEYNLGNSLALQGKYGAAIDAYTQALKLDASLKDARYNRDLVKKLLEQQSKQPDTPKNKQSDHKNGIQQNQKDDRPSSEVNLTDSPKNDEPNKKLQQQPQHENQPKNSPEKDRPSKNSNEQQGDLKDKQQPYGDKSPHNGNSEQESEPQQHTQTQQPTGRQSQSNGSEQREKPNLDKNEQQQAGSEQSPQERHQHDNPNNNQHSTHAIQQPTHPDQQGSTQITGGSSTPEAGAPTEQEATRQRLRGDKVKLDQETAQWLQQIPDDPSDLLRRKIMRDHLRKLNQTEENF